MGVALQFAVEVKAEEVMDFLVSLLKNGRPPRSNKVRSDFHGAREASEKTASEEETLDARYESLILQLQKRIDDKTLVGEYMHGQSYGFEWGRPGDDDQFFESKTMED